MTSVNLSMLAGVVLFASTIAGWMSHSLLGRSGFGVLLNTLLMLVCMCAGLAIYTLFVRQLRIEQPLVVVLVAAGSGIIGLLLLAFVKKAAASGA